jgi:hypothetical protein
MPGPGNSPSGAQSTPEEPALEYQVLHFPITDCDNDLTVCPNPPRRPLLLPCDVCFIACSRLYPRSLCCPWLMSPLKAATIHPGGLSCCHVMSVSLPAGCTPRSLCYLCRPMVDVSSWREARTLAVPFKPITVNPGGLSCCPVMCVSLPAGCTPRSLCYPCRPMVVYSWREVEARTLAVPFKAVTIHPGRLSGCPVICVSLPAGCTPHSLCYPCRPMVDVPFEDSRNPPRRPLVAM